MPELGSNRTDSAGADNILSSAEVPRAVRSSYDALKSVSEVKYFEVSAVVTTFSRAFCTS